MNIGCKTNLSLGPGGRLPIFTFNVVSTQTISGVFRTSGASGYANTIFVNWGDGTNTTYVGTTDQSYLKDYGSSGNRTVTIFAPSKSVLTRFKMTQSDANVSFTLSSLPSGLTYFYCTGINTVSGDLSSLPSGMTYFQCYGSNTVSGNLSSLPSGMTDFQCGGNNTVAGNLSSLPSGMTNFQCTGRNTVADYTSGRTWANNQTRVYLVPIGAGGLSSSEVDNLLIDLANVSTWVSPKEVYLRGANAARTSASDSAVTTLTGKGVTVTTN